MKKYENPMLQVVGINKHNIIATSGPGFNPENVVDPSDVGAPGMRGVFDPYNAGY